jgi:4-amino-4-deoxy-L-arabinose transferase-like glycosyltransferase
MRLYKREMSRLALVLVIALVARLAFVAWWQQTQNLSDRRFELPDSQSYWELGQHMARGEPYQFGTADRSVFRAPGYPLLLAGLFRVVGADAPPSAARVLGAVFGTLSVAGVYWLSRAMFSPDVAFLAAAIVAVYPEAIATSALPLSDGPFCLWMLLQLVFFKLAATGAPRRDLVFAALAGAMAGIASLTRPSWLLFTPGVVAVWAVGSQFEKRQLVLGGTMLVALALVMSPWWVHNWRVVGRFVPTTLQVGASLYDGLNPAADGSSDMRFVPRFEEQLRAADAAHSPAATDPPFEYRLDRLMRSESLDWAAAHPSRVIELAGTKLLRLWNFWPNEPSFRSWWVRLAVLVTYTPILLLAIVGAWMIRRRTFDLMLLVAPAIYLTALHVVFIGSLRYRQPAMLTLAIPAAMAVCRLCGRGDTPSNQIDAIPVS